MPQDKEAHRKVARESARRKRGQHPGSTNEGVNTIILAGVNIPEGVTLYRYIDGKRVNLDKVPEGFKVLSDGQVWQPLSVQPVVYYEPEEGTSAIKAARLLLICQSLNKHDVAHEVRYGVNGPTMDIVSETLGAS